MGRRIWYHLFILFLGLSFMSYIWFKIGNNLDRYKNVQFPYEQDDIISNDVVIKDVNLSCVLHRKGIHNNNKTLTRLMKWRKKYSYDRMASFLNSGTRFVRSFTFRNAAKNDDLSNKSLTLTTADSNNKIFSHCNISQTNLIYEVLQKVLAHPNIAKTAELSNWSIDEDLIYRYLESGDWSEWYMGERIEDSIVKAVNWRYSFGINRLPFNQTVGILMDGAAYVTHYDKHDRPIIYVKLGKFSKKYTYDNYVFTLFHCVERADRMCMMRNSSRYIAIVDLKGIKWSTSPTLTAILDSIRLLQLAYPARMGTVHIVNPSLGFYSLWAAIKPLLSRKTVGKIIMHSSESTSSQAVSNKLADLLGRGNIEEAYGGEVQVPTPTKTNATHIRHIEDYFKEYF